MHRRRFLAVLGAAPAVALAGKAGLDLLAGGGEPGAITRLGPGSATAEGAQTGPFRNFVPGAVSGGLPLDVRTSQGYTWQGGTLKVISNKGTSGTASVFGRSYPLHPEAAGGLGGFVGFGTLDPPGDWLVDVVVELEEGPRSFSFPVELRPTNWTVDHITLPPPDPNAPPPDQEELDRQAREREREAILLAETYAGYSERKWDGKWIAPVVAEVTGYFGAQRSFNGGPVGGHHSGTDFGAWLGTPVLATNAGVVVVAEEVITRGNMVIVDHGGGVFSSYCHQSEIDVVVGEAVSKGQSVGKVGTTGLSTGYHLHWEMSVGGVLVDGLRWLDGTQGF